jgi:hypothetical protein
MRAPVKQNLIMFAILSGVASFSLMGCGKTSRSGASEAAPSSSNLSSAAPQIGSPTPISTPPAGSTNQAPHSYEFVQLGGQSYVTPAIPTDNILRVKFKVGLTQDNANLPKYQPTHQASELAVIIAVNGREISPTYTSSHYGFGEINEESNVIDFSQYLTRGLPVTITVKDAQNNFYCTYLASTRGYLFGEWVNPWAGVEASCRKPVKGAQTINGIASPAHRWSGTLIVQTSSTAAIQ